VLLYVVAGCTCPVSPAVYMRNTLEQSPTPASCGRAKTGAPVLTGALRMLICEAGPTVTAALLAVLSCGS
jgi:hypothetical protein